MNKTTSQIGRTILVSVLVILVFSFVIFGMTKAYDTLKDTPKDDPLQTNVLGSEDDITAVATATLYDDSYIDDSDDMNGEIDPDEDVVDEGSPGDDLTEEEDMIFADYDGFSESLLSEVDTKVVAIVILDIEKYCEECVTLTNLIKTNIARYPNNTLFLFVRNDDHTLLPDKYQGFKPGTVLILDKEANISQKLYTPDVEELDNALNTHSARY